MTDAIATTSHFVTVQDGLKIHARAFEPASPSAALPLVCLPGLARTAGDFTVIAEAIAAGAAARPRRVIAIDYRGRGLSDRDGDWRNYDLRIENADILQALDALDVREAIFLGTSRGGLHMMVMGVTRPACIRGVILNDIGPVLEARGLARIKGYVGKLPQPKSWTDAVDLAKRVMASHFTALNEDEWLAYARLTFEETPSGLAPRYDTRLMKTLEAFNLEQPLPELWPQFDGLRHVPVLALRGENSDLLSDATLARMTERHPRCQTHVVPGQGHAPLLLDPPTIARVASFVASIDG